MKKKEVSGLDVLRVYFDEMKDHKWRFLLIFLLVNVGNSATILQPWFVKKLFNLLEVTPVAAATISVFSSTLLVLLVLKLMEWAFWRIQDLVYVPYLPNAKARLELRAFQKLLSQNEQYFQNEFSGSLTRQVRRLSEGFDNLTGHLIYEMYPTALVLLGAIIGLSLQKPILGVIFSGWIALFLTLQFIMTRSASKNDAIRDELDSSLNGTLSDSISNMTTVKSFSNEEREFINLSNAEDTLARAQRKTWMGHIRIFAIQTFFLMTIEVLLYYIGIEAWINGTVTLGDIAFIQTFLALIFFRIWDIARMFRNISETITGGKEIVTMMNQTIKIKDAEGAKPLTVKNGKIVFTKISFAFQKNQPIIKNLSLTIDAKQKVALIGPSGAGKSTMVKLLMRFFDLQKGTITIDGQNTAKVTQASLRSAISVVPQDPILFHRSLLDNIRYGKQDATMDEVIDAAKKAHCHEFISALKDGYETFVGERGVKLSGGERQRVAIARAILRNAPILVLDEATSALDSESEHLIQDALRELMKNKTVIVIAHRLSTIMMMDKIVVIENGKITDTGTHAELIKNRGTYNKLWELQAGAFGS